MLAIILLTEIISLKIAKERLEICLPRTFYNI